MAHHEPATPKQTYESDVPGLSEKFLEGHLALLWELFCDGGGRDATVTLNSHLFRVTVFRVTVASSIWIPIHNKCITD